MKNTENEQSFEPGVGALLRASRLRVGEDLRDVAAVLRIRYPYLEAIEDGRYQDLPGIAYAVGFVRTYAEHLGLDAEEVVRRFKAETENMERRTNLVFPSPIPERGTPGAAILFVGVLVAAVAYGAWYVATSEDSIFEGLVSPLPDRLATLLPGDDEEQADPAPLENIAPDGVTPSQPLVVTPPPVVEPAPMTEETEALSDPVGTPGEPAVEPMTTEPAEPEAAAQTEAEPESAPTAEEPVPAEPEAEPEVQAELAAPPAPEAPAVVESEPQPAVTATEEPAPEPMTEETPVAESPVPPVEEPVAEETPETPAPVVEEPQTAEVVEPEPETESQAAPPPAPEAPIEEAPVEEAAETTPEPAAPPAPPSVEEPVAEETPAPTEEADTQPAEPETQQAAVPEEPEPVEAVEEQAPEAAPVAGSPADGGDQRIVVRARQDSWIQVRDGVNRRLLVTRLLRAGDSYRVPDQPGLTLLTGNAGALDILVDGEPVPAIGGEGTVRRNVALDAERLLDGTAVLD